MITQPANLHGQTQCFSGYGHICCFKLLLSRCSLGGTVAESLGPSTESSDQAGLLQHAWGALQGVRNNVLHGCITGPALCTRVKRCAKAHEELLTSISRQREVKKLLSFLAQIKIYQQSLAQYICHTH